MFIKVKCCDCDTISLLYTNEENRRKATKVKRKVADGFCCGAIAVECKDTASR